MENIDLQHIVDQRSIFACPACGADFAAATEQAVTCENGHQFPVEDGLPLLYAHHEEHGSKQDVTDRIKDFYMDNPFPDYEDFDSLSNLIERSKKSMFAKALDENVPFGSKVLEVGCGTGQMSIFLSVSNRHVVGVDLCPNSLKLGRNFRDSQGLKRVNFYQMNLFRPTFKRDTFDLVYCSGVLHHTAFPRRGFESIAQLVKPGRYIIIGLYNKYLRFPTHVRRVISRVINIKGIEPVVKRLQTTKKQETWFNDQYRNPHETSHTIGDVMEWFEQNNIEFINSIPGLNPFNRFESVRDPFKKNEHSSRAGAVASQLISIPAFQREGGLFLVMGKRKRWYSERDPVRTLHRVSLAPDEEA